MQTSLPDTFQSATLLRAERSTRIFLGRVGTSICGAQDREDLHFRVLKVLQDRPDLSQRELADQVGVSNGKLHYCRNALIDKGLVKVGNFKKSKHRLGYAYLLTPAALGQKAGMTARFLNRKMPEYAALKVEIAALKAEMSGGAKPRGFGQRNEAARN